VRSVFKKLLLLFLLIALYELLVVYAIRTTNADGSTEPTPTPEVVSIELLPTPTPTPMQPPSTTPAPTQPPVATPELPDYDYPAEDARCLARGIWSVCPKYPTKETRQAFCELVQNRVDDDSGDFEDSIRWALLQGNEFPDYDPNAYRSPENSEIADYAMRSWLYAAITGDRSYRLVPQDGLYCDFYRRDGRDYITIYNRNKDVVYDSGEGTAK